MDNLPDTKTDIPPIESNSRSEEDDGVDPRVQEELERLNCANEAINHLELQLDEARKTLQELWDSSEADLFQLEKRIGSAVTKARSYYEVRIKLRDAKEALTKAKHRFERAQALHVAAKELALVAADHMDETEKTNENSITWGETYSHAIAKAADAEREKYQADLEQQRAEVVYSEIEKTVEKLQKDFRRSINKSKPYYEMKAEYHKELDFQKRKVYGLENCVNEAKSEYQKSLRNLERISNEIHEQRNKGKIRKELGERTSGVGEEQPTYTETIPSNLETTPTNSKQENTSNNTIRSCLLRTESLPTGIISNTHARYSPEGDETIPVTSDFNDQFILRAKQAPHPLLKNSSHHEPNQSRERGSSFSSELSHSTTDDDDKTGSLHVLSDEQIEHLAYEYHPYSDDLSYETDPIEQLISHFHQSNLQAKAFFRKIFKTNSINQ